MPISSMVTRWGYLRHACRHRCGVDGWLQPREDQRRRGAPAWIRISSAFAKLSIDRPLHVRFIEYMPVGGVLGFGRMRLGPDDVIPS